MVKRVKKADTAVEETVTPMVTNTEPEGQELGVSSTGISLLAVHVNLTKDTYTEKEVEEAMKLLGILLKDFGEDETWTLHPMNVVACLKEFTDAIDRQLEAEVAASLVTAEGEPTTDAAAG
jgi:hypothetical protein